MSLLPLYVLNDQQARLIHRAFFGWDLSTLCIRYRVNEAMNVYYLQNEFSNNRICVL